MKSCTATYQVEFDIPIKGVITELLDDLPGFEKLYVWNKNIIGLRIDKFSVEGYILKTDETVRVLIDNPNNTKYNGIWTVTVHRRNLSETKDNFHFNVTLYKFICDYETILDYQPYVSKPISNKIKSI